MDTMTNPELTEQENAAATLTSDSTQVQADTAPQVESDTQTDTASHPEAASPTEQPESPPETGQPKQAQAKRTAAAKKRRRMAAQRTRLHNVLLAGVFLLILLVFAFINLIVKDKDFSEAENRNLSQKPALTVAAIKDGSYFSGLSDYASDQFFARDSWMSLKLKAETIMGRKDASGIFLGKDDYLLSGAGFRHDPHGQAAQECAGTGSASGHLQCRRSALRLHSVLKRRRGSFFSCR